MQALPTPINRYAIILSTAWTLLILGSFAWSYSQQQLIVTETATFEAQVAFEKDTLYRKWAAGHGGVYVPVTADTPPNPYIPDSVERKAGTRSGRPLTLVNPAYMTRQVFALAAREHDLVRGHITSLNPIRPENAPDPWEARALAAFEKGEKEISGVQMIDGQPYLRLMRPFVTALPCLKCHAAQGYKDGDIRGGVSVSVPLSLLSANAKRIVAGTGTAHALIWLTGLCMIGLGSRRLSRDAAAIRAQNAMLEDEITERQLAQEQLQEQAAMLEEEIGERQMAQEALQEQAAMLEEEIGERQMAQEALQKQAAMLEREIAERTLAEAAIKESEEKFSKTFRNAPLIMAITAMEDGTFLEVNDKFIESSGYSREEIIGRQSVAIGWIHEDDRARIVEECQRQGRISGMDLQVHTKDGRRLTTLYFGELISIAGRTRFLSVCLDVTEHRKIETQLLHAQKMEAVGALAGGMAHDFNNVLTVIAGYATMLSLRLADDSKEFAMAEEISTSVSRAAEMTRSLLAFSRKDPMTMKPEDLNAIVSSLEKSLKRLIREDIEFRFALSPIPVPVMADRGQLEQVLVNLVVNARDAMPAGGVLAIATSVIEVREMEIGLDQGILPGGYCLITVSDSGLGMDAETRAHIFEPFFTTKDVHTGTGLGLSIVHGIVGKHNGKICVYSEKGHGTTFRIYLPLLDQPLPANQSAPANSPLPGGDETILLADDDADIRQVASLLLEDRGYKVLVADNGETALALFRNNRERIKLLVTDVVMPKMNGKELFQEIQKMTASVPALFMSGYTCDITGEMMQSGENSRYLPKPIKLDTFLLTIRQLLDQANPP